LLYSAAPFFRGAWRDLKLARPGMDVPVALGLAAAFSASAWATLGGGGAVYYDSVTMFVALLLVARYVELVARRRAGDAVEAIARARPQRPSAFSPGRQVRMSRRSARRRSSPGIGCSCDRVRAFRPMDGSSAAGPVSRKRF